MDLLRSLPIGLYLEQPVTWLHRIDPRAKLTWLLAFMLTPIAANSYWRLSLVGWLMLLTISTWIPFRVWRRQMGLVIIFSVLFFGVMVLAPDGLRVDHQSRLPANDLNPVEVIAAPPEAAENLTPLPTITLSEPLPLPQPTDYRYILVEQGIILITRRSLELAIRVSTLIFTLIYTTNLYLLTTAPEEITAGLADVMRPLKRLNLPVTEIILTLTLSLRFIPLVLEEVQNLVRSVRTRAINWKKLGFRGGMQVWLMVAERMLDNLLLRAEQIASAMQIRGFTSPDQHQVEWHQLRMMGGDWVIVVGAGLFCVARLIWGGN